MPTALNLLSKSAEAFENRIKTPGMCKSEAESGEENETGKAKPKAVE